VFHERFQFCNAGIFFSNDLLQITIIFHTEIVSQKAAKSKQYQWFFGILIGIFIGFFHRFLAI